MTKRNNESYHLPALKCVMGDRGYFVTAMRFDEIAKRIQPAEEVHQSKKLCEWIQRELEAKHASAISKYLKNAPARFFNAIVVGVYGGNPEWAEINVGDPRGQLSEEEADRINRTVGILVMNGRERLFPIDGRHRVAGIKKAVVESTELLDDEITVIMVGHAKTEMGKDRTKRLFVTLNNNAKKASDRDIVALAEDNGLAVIARSMIDEFALLNEGEFVSFSKSANIPETDVTSITSVIGLYQIVMSLYPRSHERWPSLAEVKKARPEDDILKEMYDYNCSYWTFLVDHFKQMKEVLLDRKRTSAYYRDVSRNHLLFRPAGQKAFARAVQFMVSQGRGLEESIELLSRKIEPWLNKPDWENILWNPVSAKMINSEVPAAESLLCRYAGLEARSIEAMARLDRLIRDRTESG
jgi:DNA sulfur modification protein DndB